MVGSGVHRAWNGDNTCCAMHGIWAAVSPTCFATALAALPAASPAAAAPDATNAGTCRGRLELLPVLLGLLLLLVVVALLDELLAPVVLVPACWLTLASQTLVLNARRNACLCHACMLLVPAPEL